MNPAAPPVPAAGNEFLKTVGAPLIWIGVGYLLATLIQRPTRSPKHA